MDTTKFSKALNAIDIEDLQYVEKDLCFYELVSLGFLLYGEDHSTSEFILQKLLVISNATLVSSATPIPRNLLRTYAANVNKDNWRPCLVEALAIINARRVLRKLGFKWETISQHYLPHISELSLHIHPLLKALYKICENMTSAEAGRLMLYMDEHFRRPGEYLRFYDKSCLEVFLLDWITRRIIRIGDREANGAELHVLFEYFKLNDLEDLKLLLIETLKHNANNNHNSQRTDSDSSVLEIREEVTGSTTVQTTNSDISCDESLNDLSHCYEVRYETAGIVLIINQKEFHEEPNPEWKHLLPKKKLSYRKGTDNDRDIMKSVFSAHGYKPVVRENLTHIELLHCIRENAKRSECYDSFIVCIFSHGFNGVVCGSNSIPVEIAEIEGIFAMEELNRKPKLLIVQACQTDQQHSNSSEKRKADPKRCPDILKTMSTVPGFNAIRHISDGSWYIQTLACAIKDFGQRKHLCDIMTIVNAKVAEKRDKNEPNEVMLPMYASTLRRDFFLPKRKEII